MVLTRGIKEVWLRAPGTTARTTGQAEGEGGVGAAAGAAEEDVRIVAEGLAKLGRV